MGQLSRLFFWEKSNRLQKIVYWKKNIFLLPSGQTRKSFIDWWTMNNEFSRLMNEWIHESPLKDIACKSNYSNARSPFTEVFTKIKIKRSLEIIGKLNETILCRRNHGVVERSRVLKVFNKPSIIAKISKKFTRKMRKDNINSVIKLCTGNIQNGVPPLNDQTLHQSD